MGYNIKHLSIHDWIFIICAMIIFIFCMIRAHDRYKNVKVDPEIVFVDNKGQDMFVRYENRYVPAGDTFIYVSKDKQDTVMIREEKPKTYQDGYLQACEDCYEYLSPEVWREHHLNQVKPEGFADFMWGNRGINGTTDH